MSIAIASPKTLPAAFDLASRGIKVIPLLPNDKRPRINDWQNAASSDEEQIAEWWEKWPDSNLGGKLGPDSDIIDVEGDDAEAERQLLTICDGQIPLCPTYSSGARGNHRLFKWSPGFPRPDKAVFKIGKLEFRTGNGGNGAQSVFPPSIHPSGSVYRWLPGFGLDDVPLGEFSREAMAKIWNLCGEDSIDAGKERKPPEHWQEIAAGVSEGNRNAAAASFFGMLFRDMADVFDDGAVARQWLMAELWNRSNSPPMNPRELEATFKSILNRERQRRTAESFHLASRPAPTGEAPKDGEPSSGSSEWRLEIRDAKPKVFCLFSPLWSGPLELTAADMKSARAIGREALEQKSVWLAKDFARAWEGTRETPGLGPQLTESATHVKADAEQHRDRVIASLLLEQLLDAEVLEEGAGVDPRGRPQLLADGSVVFLFTRVWKEMTYGPDRITRNELSKTLERFKAETRSWHHKRFFVLSKEQMIELERFAGGESEPDARTHI